VDDGWWEKESRRDVKMTMTIRESWLTRTLTLVETTISPCRTPGGRMTGNILLDEIDVLERRCSSVLMIHRALCGVNKFVPLDLLLKDQTLDATTTISYEY
jgi:hypothetical protein